MEIKIANTEFEILDTFAVMKELRPQLDIRSYVSVIENLMKDGYRIAYLKDDEGHVVCAGGFRIGEMLHRGKYLYLDDLSTLPEERSKGYGSLLLDFLIDYARKENCDTFHLDSGVTRFGAHRFYLRKGFDITSHHFAMKLKGG